MTFKRTFAIILHVFSSSLSNLVSLELRENILKTLPQSISFLVNLERLDLGANELSELVSGVITQSS